ncbi:MAG: hypothetical protein AB1716_14190 [Planctomycetota bacterium]
MLVGVEQTALSVSAARRPRPALLAAPAPAALEAPASLPIMGGTACDVCGALARLQVLEGYRNGQPAVRRVCLTCAEATVFTPARRRPSGHLRIGQIAVLLGLVLIALGLFGDWLVPARHGGFGWKQQSGLMLGSAVLFFGLLLGAELVALAGGLLLGGAVCADWFGLAQGPGIGWRQQTLAAAGALLILGGGLRSRWALRRRSAAPAAARPAGTWALPVQDVETVPTGPSA